VHETAGSFPVTEPNATKTDGRAVQGTVYQTFCSRTTVTVQNFYT